jgi:hypothetical protein
MGESMINSESDPRPMHLVVLSDDGFQRLNAHGFMKGLLKDGKNLHCVDVDYGPLLRLKASVAYSPNGSKEVRHMTVGLSIQYSDVSFVLSSDAKEQPPSGNQFQGVPTVSPLNGIKLEQKNGTLPR